MALGKKEYLIGFALVLIALLFIFSGSRPGKVDDWRFVPDQQEFPGLLPIFVAVALGVAGGILIWFALSIYLIVSGKPIRSGKTQRANPKRFMGIFALVGGIALPLALALLTFAGFALIQTVSFVYYLFPFLLAGYLILGIAAAVRKKALIGIIPLVLSVILPTLLLLGLGILDGSTRMSAGSFASGGMPLMASPGLGIMDFAKSSSAVSGEMGFSVGGAKDIGNFRANVENGYLPIESDLTYEGLFYNYYFDTGSSGAPCGKLFCPSYSLAVSRDPFSGREDHYLSVGLDSNLTEVDFSRKKLNLVIVLDISGSMGSGFSSYYYDRFGNRVPSEDGNASSETKSKIRVATESIAALLDKLKEDDRLGIVFFDDRAYLAKPLGLVRETDIEAIKGHLLEVEDQGGTNMYAGMSMGTELVQGIAASANPEEYENRIIFLTDAMPNTGYVGENDFFSLAKENAGKRIHTTFIGIGVDFNTELVEAITKVRGANYYSVHASSEFRRRMADEFELMVTPLVFNLTLNLQSSGFSIEKIYGSPEANESTGEILRVNTLFPSRTNEEGTRGGVILVKLRKLSESPSISLTVGYEDRTGKPGSSAAFVDFSGAAAGSYPNTGIRKAILLSRYADVLKNWVIDERLGKQQNKTVVLFPSVNSEDGIPIPPMIIELGQWERQSLPLSVSPEQAQVFRDLLAHFAQERAAIGDSALEQEERLLGKLASASPA